ncbi:MAG: leucine-rich repeat domain-containing protein [Lachnospiraceae bacterium]|jgi:hypothetical protein|nr:leucine-rich repeat domain-containing protein [Lachnospiraceae bacterium]
MRRPIQNVLGALLLITALICTQIPALPTAASTQASGDMIMEGSTLVQYVGTAKTLVIPSSVKSIGENAFAACTTLESVSIPTDVTSIGGAAFSNCTSLKSVYIKGSGLRSLGDGAFAGCTNLPSVSFEGGANFVCADGLILSDDKSVLFEVLPGAKIKSLNIPTSVKKMSDFAAWGCDTIEQILVPSSLSTIPAYAFTNCTGIKVLDFPASVRYIRMKAFANCVNLAKVNHTPVTQIDPTAFDGCPLLTDSDVRKAEDQDTNDAIRVDTVGNGSVSGNDVSGNSVSGNDASKQDTDTQNTTGGDGQTDGNGDNSGTGVGDGNNFIHQNEDGTYSYVLYAGGDNLANSKIVGNKAVLFVDNSKQTLMAGESVARQPAVEDGSILVSQVKSDTFHVMSGNGDTTEDAGAPTEEQVSTSTSENAPDGDIQSAEDQGSVLSLQEMNRSISDSAEKAVSLPKFTVYQNAITAQAFYRSEDTKEFEFPSDISSIRDFAFARSGLTSITIPDSVKEIDYAAFYHCDNLTDVSIPTSVSRIEAYAFDHTPYLQNFYDNGTADFLVVGDGVLLAYRGNGSNLVLPDGVKHIAAYAFAENENLTSVAMPDSLETIEEAAFQNCHNLTNVTLPEGLTTIEDRAFAGCPITDIVMPSTLKYLGLSSMDVSTSKASDAEVSVTFRGMNLPKIRTNDSTNRLSAKDYRTLALKGVDYVILPKGSHDFSGTVGDPLKRGMIGIVFESDGSSAVPIKEITGAIEEQMPLPASLLSGGQTLSVVPGDYSATKSVLYASKEGEETGIQVLSTSNQVKDDITAMLSGNSEKLNLHVEDNDIAKNILSSGYRNAYGEDIPENIIAVSMSLYDPTDSVNITKLGKQYMKITMDVPKELQKNGTLHVITADEDGQLEELDYTVDSSLLNHKLTFKTNHFSPIGFYSYEGNGTGNVQIRAGKVIYTEGNVALDDTPDTGDLIHPKWFLVFGFLFTGIALLVFANRKKVV